MKQNQQVREAEPAEHRGTDLGGEVSLGLELFEERGEEESGEEEDDGPEEDVWDEGSFFTASRPNKLSLQVPTSLQTRTGGLQAAVPPAATGGRWLWTSEPYRHVQLLPLDASCCQVPAAPDLLDVGRGVGGRRTPTSGRDADRIRTTGPLQNHRTEGINRLNKYI